MGILLIWLLGVGVWHVYKPLPQGTHMRGPVHTVPANAVTFIADRTFVDAHGTRASQQQIFDTVMAMIDGAQDYILIDMFLFNDFLGTQTQSYRALSAELTAHLIAQQRAHPDMTIIFITDPINTVYGGARSPFLERLTRAGVQVITTDLTRLRDSNPAYSAFWRTFVQWWGNSTQGGHLPHLMDARAGRITLRSYLAALNFKANHRKVIVADYTRADGTRGMHTLITSANPHDGSSAHSNVALKVDELLWRDVVASERAVARFSGADFAEPEMIDDRVREEVRADGDTVRVQLLTEGAIKEALIKNITTLTAGDTLDMMMFYLADRDVMHALTEALARGVQMRIILDPNKDAFGRKKNGVPNRQVAAQLHAHPSGHARVRWCDTHGEQCHSKMVIMRRATGETALLLGSANLTRRNIGDYNMETDVLVRSRRPVACMRDAQQFFDEQWHNDGARRYTRAYEAYKDERIGMRLLYRIMEATGMSSF